MKKYLFLPGGLMMVAGLMWAAFTLRWDTTAVVLGIGGLLAFAVAVAASWQNVRDWFRDPRGIFVLNSIFTTLLLVAILGLVNAIAGFRAASLDMTAAGRNTLAADTRAGLRRLDREVTVRQFGRVRDVAVDGLLSAFASASSRLRVVFVDVERAPQDARAYGISRDGTVIVSAGGKWRKVEKPTEPALFAAITQVIQTTEPVICFATGEGEHGLDDEGGAGLSQFAAALASAGYRAERASLQQGGVPQACEVFVIAGPRTPPGPDMFARIDAYLRAGGRIAVLLDPPVDPGWAAWLSQRGVVAGAGVIIEHNPAARQVGAGPERPIAVPYSTNHPITRGFEMPTIYDRVVPLSVNERAETVLPQPLFRTSSRSFERTDPAAPEMAYREGRDRPGPLAVALAAEIGKGTRDDKRLRNARFVVFGDSDFVTNTLFGTLSNRDLALRVVAWLAGEQEARAVSAADRQNRRTTLTERTRTVMYAVNMGLLPLLPLLAGLIQLIRSRR